MSNQLKPAIDGQDHSQGPQGAPLELVEYGDYQCSYCGEAYPAIKAAQQTLGDKLQFVFRNFPLSEAHPQARQAALAAEAAALQGKFWKCTMPSTSIRISSILPNWRNTPSK